MDDISERFLKIFKHHIDKKIVLYGLSDSTGIIVNNCKDFNFIGLLDGYRTEGNLFGIPMLELSELTKQQADEIIIIARLASTRIIWERIREICKEKDIPVYDMYGNLLSRDFDHKVSENHSDKPVINIPFSYVHRQIADHDVISFDIFDTLLKRKVRDRDIFFGEVAEKCGVEKRGFVNYRMRAEFELSVGNAAPKLNDIYESIFQNASYSHTMLWRLKEEEIGKEKRELFHCVDGADLLQYAVSLKKEIYLVSDMYLDRDIIENILTDNGIEGYKDIFISCEYGCDKRHGLFEILKKKSQGKTYLHIGDSEEADGTSANNSGMDALIIDCTTEKAAFYYPTLSKYRISSPYQFGYTVFAPIMAEFCNWLIKISEEIKPDCILFLARDGYLFEKMYRLAKARNPKLPEGKYFLFSRSAGSLCYIENEEQLKYVASLPYDGSNKELMMYRFRFDEDELLCHLDNETAVKYALRHKENVFEKAEEMRADFLKYYNEIALKNSKVLLIDFVSTGSCQMYLEGILKRKVQGAYFMRIYDTNTDKGKLDTFSFLDSNACSEETNSVEMKYFLLEQIIKAQTGTVIGYDVNGKPIFEERMTDEADRFITYGVQKGILDYYEDYLFGNKVPFASSDNLRDSLCKAESFLKYLDNDMSDIMIDGFSEYVISDIYTGRRAKAEVYL